eukprot:6182691-Pleurochrysis_carterae.AAC.1
MAAGTACPPAALPRADRSADALGLREDTFVELDVAKADNSEAVDPKQVYEVAAAALVNAKANAFCNLKGRACLALGRLVSDGRGTSGDKGVVDGHDRVNSPRPVPLAQVGCCKADAAGAQLHETPDSFSIISLRTVGHVGLVEDQQLAKQSVEVFLK